VMKLFKILKNIFFYLSCVNCDISEDPWHQDHLPHPDVHAVVSGPLKDDLETQREYEEDKEKSLNDFPTFLV